MEFRTDSLLNGRYRIERELGRGGIGVVYFGRDERVHNKPVVIKFLLDDNNDNSEVRNWLCQKFLQEAEALSRIDHPCVVKVSDCGMSEDDRPFFVMEYIDGRSLTSVIKPNGLDIGYAADILKQIGNGLHAAHQQKVIHRDLKPDNVLLQSLSTGEVQVKLIDFGIAKVKDSNVGPSTAVPIVAGTYFYAAPEQLLGKTVTETSDIYAFGVIAYELLIGIRPFNVGSSNSVEALQQILRMQQSEAIIPPKQMRPEIPQAAQMLILSALTFDPQRRPQDAGIFAKDLVKSLVGEIVGQAEQPPNQRMTEIVQPTLKVQSTVDHKNQPAQQRQPYYRSDSVYKTPPRIELSHSDETHKKQRMVVLFTLIMVFLLEAFPFLHIHYDKGWQGWGGPEMALIVFVTFMNLVLYFYMFLITIPRWYKINRVKELRERVDKIRKEILIVEKSILKEKHDYWYRKLDGLNSRLYEVKGNASQIHLLFDGIDREMWKRCYNGHAFN